MASKRDYYDILGVTKNATDAELKKAYRRLAMKFHPDRNIDDASAEGKFKEAKEAYDVLSDSRKRAAYDQFGHAGVDQSIGGGVGPGAGGFGDIFDSVFGDIFGGGARGGGPGVFRGADLRYNLDLDLGDAVSGTTIRIRVPKLTSCNECNGSGAKKGSSPVNCPTCGGQGQVRMQQAHRSVQKRRALHATDPRGIHLVPALGGRHELGRRCDRSPAWHRDREPDACRSNVPPAQPRGIQRARP